MQICEQKINQVKYIIVNKGRCQQMENVLIAITCSYLWYVHCRNASDTYFLAIWFPLFLTFKKGLK